MFLDVFTTGAAVVGAAAAAGTLWVTVRHHKPSEADDERPQAEKAAKEVGASEQSEPNG